MTSDQIALRDLMSDISERLYFAGWMMGLEFALWATLRGGSLEYGFGEVSQDEIAALERLAKACGGWIYWAPAYDGSEFGEGSGETFIPLAEWEAMYRAHM